MPKPGAQRRTRAVRDVTVLAPGGKPAPKLPTLEGRKWSPLVRRWWVMAWASPSAAMWPDGDQFPLELMALYLQDLVDGDRSARAEVRHFLNLFGLTPESRRRYGWEIERGGGPEARQAAGEPQPVDDMRDRLTLVRS